MRKHLVFIVSGLSLALAACNVPIASIPTSPVEVANSTTIDDSAAIAVESLNKAWLTLIDVGINAGVIKGDTATKVLAIDDRITQAITAARLAYAAGNAETFTEALRKLRAAVDEGSALIRGK